ncbi:MAG: hypothetical protein Kow0069_07240 [Promethearchaeota archaeon]
MEVYGLLVCAANGMPLLTLVTDDGRDGRPMPRPDRQLGLDWGEDGNKLIGGFISAMNLFCEEIIKAPNETMRVSVDWLYLTTVSHDIEQSEDRVPAGSYWLDRLTFVLVHGQAPPKAAEYLLHVLVEKFFALYDRAWIAKSLAEGRIPFPNPEDAAAFRRVFHDTLSRFKITRDVTQLEMEFDL